MSGGSQACAACKYQRRKCAPTCLLAPFFPPDAQRQFLNAHRLFGVSNITKILRKVDASQREAAMRTIIFQSNVRAADPVGGCYRIINELQRQIYLAALELQLVLQRLAQFRDQAAQHHVILAAPAPHAGGYQDPPQTTAEPYLPEDRSDSRIDYRFPEEASSSSRPPQQAYFVDDCEEIKPFLASFDDKHFVESIKDSGKIEFNSIPQESPSDVRGTAALFTLTKLHD